jgi:hypothetical protein
MHRFCLLILAGLAGAFAANAGQIQIGGANGLTAAYVGATTWSERNYTASMFENATVTPAGGQINVLPLQTGGSGAGAGTMTDVNGISFSMINDGSSSNATNNVWTSNTSGTLSITVPINVAAVQNVYVMLNDLYGYAGENASISFNFASGADVITLADLVNGTGAVRSTLDCTSATGTVSCPATTNTGSHTVSASLPSLTNTNTSGDATIVTRAIWNGSYTIVAGGSTIPYGNATSGSSGNVMLDELAFSFSTNYGNTTLNSITITTDAGNAGGNSRLALSAITVATATPEPSTIALFGTGLGLFGFVRRRRGARSA